MECHLKGVKLKSINIEFYTLQNRSLKVISLNRNFRKEGNREYQEERNSKQNKEKTP